MKKIFLLFTLAIPLGVFSQRIEFKISGNLDSISDSEKIFLQYRQGSELITDSATFVEGKFTFVGSISEAARATLSIGESLAQANRSVRKTIYLERSPLQLKSSSDLSQAILDGGDLTKDVQRLDKLLAPITENNRRLNQKYRETPGDQRSEDFLKQFRLETEVINEERKSIIKTFINQNPNSLVSLDNINNVAGYAPEVEDIEPLFLSLSASLRHTDAGKRYAENIEKIRLTSVGKKAPLFEQEDVNGKLVSLADFKGKYVLIDFWASWCGPCRQENPNVVKAYQALKDKGFTVLGVSLDRPGQKDAWLKAVEVDKLTWTQVSDLNFWDNVVARQYNIQSIPQNFLIDPNGVIVAKNLRGEDLTQKIQQYLK